MTPQNAAVIEIAKQSENHLVQGPSIPENEVDASFDEAFLEIMPELIVKKSVLGAKEAAAPERCHVTADPYGNSLCTYSSRFRSWCCILMKEMRERTSGQSGLQCLLKRNIKSLHKGFSYTLKLMFFCNKARCIDLDRRALGCSMCRICRVVPHDRGRLQALSLKRDVRLLHNHLLTETQTHDYQLSSHRYCT